MLFFLSFQQPAQSDPIKQWPAQFRARSAQRTAGPVQKGQNFVSVEVATIVHPPMPTPQPAQVREDNEQCENEERQYP